MTSMAVQTRHLLQVGKPAQRSGSPYQGQGWGGVYLMYLQNAVTILV